MTTSFLDTKAWFPLNFSVIATNRSCLLARTLLRFAGFHRQPSLGLLQGLWYLEAWKSRSASGRYLIINNDFPKVVVIFFVFYVALFFLKDRNFFLFFLRCWFL